MTIPGHKFLQTCKYMLLSGAAVLLMTVVGMPAFADGGKGGYGGGSSGGTGGYQGGAGGTVGAAGVVGEGEPTGSGSGGGGGGGSGSGAGAGGGASNGAWGGFGGSGGAHGYSGTTLPASDQNGAEGVDGTSGDPGNKDDGDGRGGGGGGGGAGGYGAYVGPASTGTVNHAALTAGNGGNGGGGGNGGINSDGTGSGGGGGNGGGGGDGGVGLWFSGDALKNYANVKAGDGGNGGSGGNVDRGSGGWATGWGPGSAGDGGNGGNGGVGLSVFGASDMELMGSTIRAGDGGNGGDGGGESNGGSDGNGGNGGNGGSGISFSNGTLRVDRGSKVIGGKGGHGGAGGTDGTDGVAGAGGVGIIGMDLTIDDRGGTIVGGLSGTGVRADAIHFTGGTNALTLDSTSVITGGIRNDGTGLTMDQSGDTTYDGAITGAGSLTKTGAGTLILNGANDYDGGTTVSEGTLEVGDAAHGKSASIPGDVLVNKDGTLRGHGSVGTASAPTSTLMNNGIVWPGGSIGTLTVNGNYTQSATGTLMIDVSPTAASQLRVTDTATLNGTLSLLYGPGTYKSKSYEIVSAGTAVSGKFSSVKSNASSITQALSYGTNSVYLTPSGSLIIAPTNATIFGDMGSAIVRAGQRANDALLERAVLACPAASDTGCASTGQHLWLQANGTFTDVDGNNGAPNVHDNRYGFLLGTDHRFGSWTAGLAAGYSHSDLRESGGDAIGKIDTARLAVYGGRTLGAVHLAGTASYAYDFTSTERDFSGFGDTRDDSHAQEFTAALRAGIPVKLSPAMTLTPHIGLRYANVHGLAAGESGLSSQQLNAESQTLQSLQPYTGVTLDYAFRAGDTSRLSHLRVRAGYAYETLSSNRDVTVTSSDGTAFVIPGTQDSRGMVTAGLGLDMPIGKFTRMYARYDAVLPTGNVTSQRAQVGVSFRF